MTTAKQIKKKFAKHFIEKFVVANEVCFFHNPDIVAVDRDLFYREYEIKVTLADLRRELKVIDEILALPEGTHATSFESKYVKHDLYLKGPKNVGYCEYDPFYCCPATFTFLISKKLYDKEKQRLDRLPYGVMDSDTFEIIKPAKHLRWTKKVSAYNLWKIAHNLAYKTLDEESDEDKM